MEQFRNIGIIGRLGSSQVLDTVRRLKRFLLDRHLHVILEDTIAEVLPGHGLQTSSRKMLGEVCDMVIVVGGMAACWARRVRWPAQYSGTGHQPGQPGFPHRHSPR
jgi:NAD kinase